MPRTVVLPKNVGVFTQVGKGSLLGRTGGYLPMGTTIDISDPQTMVYDHRDHIAVSFIHEDSQKYWILVREMGIPELIN